MKKIFEAKITWLSAAEGGRKSGIPVGDGYQPSIRITKPFTETCESAVVKLFVKYAVGPMKTRIETVCDITYLSDDAPDNLSIGTEFELLEDSGTIGTGIILRERHVNIWESLWD